MALTSPDELPKHLGPDRAYYLPPALSAASLDHSKDMVRLGFRGHDSPIKGKEKFWDRAANFGTRANLENIFFGRESAQAAFDWWMNSPGHRDAILSPNATRMGVGRERDHWTQMFGK